MRILDISERSVPISRYADPATSPGGLTTSIVAVVTDAVLHGEPAVGYGFSSMGRFAQGGLIRERFAPRLLGASEGELANAEGTNLDPFRAWNTMMAGEKPGGHGERCVAVGTLDMALWDAAAKIANQPLYRFLARHADAGDPPIAGVPVYASGGYPYPHNDAARLGDEVRRLLSMGYTRIKIKVGAAPLPDELRRIETVLRLLPSGGQLAVDAMNAYDGRDSLAAAAELEPYGLWWFEDVCDPLDFDTLAAVAAAYGGAIASGEALFSAAEAKLLDRHGGLRKDRDVLLFDPVHCYGLPGFLRILECLGERGWSRSSFWPHGGHLFCLHIVQALGLGGAEVNPLCFQPFGGLTDGPAPEGGSARPPDAPGIGLEQRQDLHALLRSLLDTA
jgi:L-alanine-DL-glutamate epimerase-like enolase superfamily enzyme